MQRHRFLIGGALLAAAWTSASAQQAEPQVLDVQGAQIRVVTVATGLVHPWSIALLPGDRSMLVAERNGRVRLIEDDALVAEPVWSAEGVAAGNELKWLALHPRFESNRLVYLSYPKAGERGTTLAVARGRFDGRKLHDVREIFVADAWETGGNMGGKILFGPDETLYVTVGDRDRLCCTGTEDNSLRMKAQDLSNHVGKTLRIRDDGTVPPDNPFVGRAGAKPEIFTYGHRNGYGLAFHPETGELWQAEIGPDGRRRGQHPAARPQLRLAARVDGPQLHGLARVGHSRTTATAWTTRGCSGCRRSARRACCSTPANGSRSGAATCSSAR